MMKKKLVPLLFSLLLFACTGKRSVLQKRFFRMDTITDISIVVENSRNIKDIWNSVDSLLTDWEQKYSIESEHSEVKILNNRTDSVMPVKSPLKEIISAALQYGDTLDGGFDFTILPVKVLWGFGENAVEDSTIPSPEQIKSALSAVDYKKVRISGDSVYFSSTDTRIDVGGIAKGFVLREVAGFLESKKIQNYLISAGGDIVSKGKRADGKSWRVGIQHPRTGRMVGVFEIDSGSVVTSGDYERFRIVQGKRYHHIFNPKTGYCSDANQSVTIYGKDPVEVDVLSTGLFGRSAPDILKFVNERPRLECVIVDSGGTIWISDGWKNRIELIK
ncbi:MAG: FAD:protein FMN transferase [Fibrobacter sp.]|nr:FAD:protein FMN transferase [Fibrobacter sp.]